MVQSDCLTSSKSGVQIPLRELSMGITIGSFATLIRWRLKVQLLPHGLKDTHSKLKAHSFWEYNAKPYLVMPLNPNPVIGPD